MKGNPLSPNIFNMVVDAKIRNWGMVVAGKEVGTEDFGREV